MSMLKPVVHLHNLPVSCHIIPCNWQDRGAYNLSFTSLDQLFQGPEVPLGCSQPPLCCLSGKPVEGNNQWAVPGWEDPSYCPLPGLQGANTPPVCWVQGAYQTTQKAVSNNYYSSFFVNWDHDDWFNHSISSSRSPVLCSFPLHFSTPPLGWADYQPDDTSYCCWCCPWSLLGAAPGSVPP